MFEFQVLMTAKTVYLKKKISRAQEYYEKDLKASSN